jgi:CBS domain-containing membrane protein
MLGETELILLTGSFGATAVLLYSAIASDLAQPRNCLFGHMISAFIGVAIKKCFGNNDFMWLQAPLAVSFSILFMNLTKTLHPPGGATSLIAVMPNPTI